MFIINIYQYSHNINISESINISNQWQRKLDEIINIYTLFSTITKSKGFA